MLLLEAGPDENEISDVPSLAAYLQLSGLDWQYKTEPTGTACLGKIHNIYYILLDKYLSVLLLLLVSKRKWGLKLILRPMCWTSSL